MMVSMLRRLLIAALVCSAVPLGVARAQDQVRIQPGIVRLLEDRGRAWTSRDRALLAGTLRPGAFARDQLAAFDHASEVPLALARWDVVTRFSAGFAPDRVRARYPDAEVVAHHVAERLQLADVEPVPFLEDAFYTFVREQASADDPYDGWRLAADDDFAPLGVLSPQHLWDTAPVRVVRSDHFMLLAHPQTVDEVGPVLDQAEAALSEARRFWPRTAHERYAIIVPATTAELGRLLQATVDLSKFVAFAAGSVDRERTWEPLAARLYINLPNFLRYDPDGRRSILAHELIHAVTRPVAGPFMPVWVEEGLAMMGSEPESGLRGARGGQDPRRFPPDDEFFVGPTRDIVRTYSRSQVALELLRDRVGMEGVATFYTTLGAVRVAPGTAEHHAARAAEAAGWPVGEWEAAWTAKVG